MKIKVDEQNIDQFIRSDNTTILAVPDYQRPYSWDISQWEDFWNDITSLQENDIHFLGSVVLIAGSHEPGNFNFLEIVDGQQRLTTISLFIKAFQDKYKSLGKEDFALELDKFLYSEILRRGRRLKLNLAKKDNADYEKLFVSEIPENTKGSQIFKAYDYFQRKVSEAVNMDEIFDRVIFNLNFVVISTDSDKSAYRLFETLNDRGLELSAVDLIKNHLLKVASQQDNEAVEKIKSSWEDIMNALEGIDKVRFFRQYILSSELFETRGKITKDGLYDRFVEIIQSMEDLPTFVADIAVKSLLYSKLVNCSFDQLNVSENEIINKQLKNLSAIKAATSYTLLLRAFSRLSRVQDLIKLFNYIEVFAVRRIVVGTSTNDLDIIYNSLALDAFSDEHWEEKVRIIFEKNLPSDIQFEESFRTTQFQENNQTKYILDKIEVEGFGSGNQGRMVSNGFNVHIEHIAPQTMNNFSLWEGFDGLDKQSRKDYIMRIGNLTLLEKKPNIRASNSVFSDKKNFYTSESTDMLMTQKLLDYDQWGLSEIEQRSTELARMAVKVWSYN